MTTMKVFKWFWAWDDEKEEAWLCEMAHKGWHFKSVTPPGFYTLENGQARNDVYRLDFFTDHKAKADYLQLFRDAGWDYLGEMGSWQYFRKTAAEGETPEIFSDNESKSKKYQRIMFILIALMPIYVVNLNNLNKRTGTFNGILTFIIFLFALFFGYAIIRLGLRVNQLKKKL